MKNIHVTCPEDLLPKLCWAVCCPGALVVVDSQDSLLFGKSLADSSWSTAPWLQGYPHAVSYTFTPRCYRPTNDLKNSMGYSYCDVTWLQSINKSLMPTQKRKYSYHKNHPRSVTMNYCTLGPGWEWASLAQGNPQGEQDVQVPTAVHNMWVFNMDVLPVWKPRMVGLLPVNGQ